MSNPSKAFAILMADDDADDRLLARDAISECELPVAVQTVENGEELLEFLRSEGKFAGREPQLPGLILLDLNMPRKDGREALAEIKADPKLKKIPVVVLTTSKADSDISKIYKLGANSFIAKPAAFDSLVEVMRAIGGYWFKTVELPVK